MIAKLFNDFSIGKSLIFMCLMALFLLVPIFSINAADCGDGVCEGTEDVVSCEYDCYTDVSNPQSTWCCYNETLEQSTVSQCYLQGGVWSLNEGDEEDCVTYSQSQFESINTTAIPDESNPYKINFSCNVEGGLAPLKYEWTICNSIGMYEANKSLDLTGIQYTSCYATCKATDPHGRQISDSTTFTFSQAEAEEELWCCLNGSVVKKTSTECDAQGGSIHTTESEAQTECGGTETITNVWCCFPGGITQLVSTHMCSGAGGTAHPSQAFSESVCNPSESEGEKWCCANGNVELTDQTGCDAAGGTLYDTESEAQIACEGGTEEEEEKYCCLNEEVHMNTASWCDAQGGSIHDTEAEALAVCGEGEEGNIWCCFESGVVQQVSNHMCSGAGGSEHSSEAEAQTVCEPTQGEGEKWCCANGNVELTDAVGCDAQGGTLYDTEAEANAACEEEYEDEKWCCDNGWIDMTTPSDCAKRGGTVHETEAEAEAVCTQEYENETWCCSDGFIDMTTPDECARRGGTVHENEQTAIAECEGGKDGGDLEHWCCSDGNVDLTTLEICDQRGGTFHKSEAEAEAVCEPKYEEENERWCCIDDIVALTTAEDCNKIQGAYYQTEVEAIEACNTDCLDAYCGDGECVCGESCESCPSDCGICGTNSCENVNCLDVFSNLITTDSGILGKTFTQKEVDDMDLENNTCLFTNCINEPNDWYCTFDIDTESEECCDNGLAKLLGRNCDDNKDGGDINRTPGKPECSKDADCFQGDDPCVRHFCDDKNECNIKLDLRCLDKPMTLSKKDDTPKQAIPREIPKDKNLSDGKCCAWSFVPFWCPGICDWLWVILIILLALLMWSWRSKTLKNKDKKEEENVNNSQANKNASANEQENKDEEEKEDKLNPVMVILPIIALLLPIIVAILVNICWAIIVAIIELLIRWTLLRHVKGWDLKKKPEQDEQNEEEAVEETTQK